MIFPQNCIRFGYILTLLAGVAFVSGAAILAAYLTRDPANSGTEHYIAPGRIACVLFGLYLFSTQRDWSRALSLPNRFKRALGLSLFVGTFGAAGMYAGARMAPSIPATSLEQAWVIGAFVAVLLPAFIWWLFKRSEADDGNFIRGTTMLSFAKAHRRAEALRLPDERTLLWGGVRLPERFSEGHFALIGAVGSGKTLAMRLLMQTVLPSIKPKSDWRALVYDAKRDVLSLIAGMGVDCPVVTLNPFDARSAAWDMAKDITSPATALQVATILIPEEDGQNRYFSDAARAILTGVMNTFLLRSPGAWTFRDVVFVMRTEARLRDLLSSRPETRDLIDQYFLEARSFENIKSTIASRMAMFEPIAALWSRATRTISLHDWLAGEFILVLGNDESLRAPLDAINRVLFQRVGELVINGDESRSRRTWFFLDEIKEAGKLKALSSLLTKGRSKGARVVLGFQDIDGLRDVYGPLAANEIAGIPANKALLRLDSEATAKWAAGVLGEAELHEYTDSDTSGKDATTTTTEHIVKRDAVLPSELLRLPLPELGAFWGYYITPAVGVYLAKRTYHGVLLDPGTTPNFEPRLTEHQYLAPWNDEDLRRLGFDVEDQHPELRLQGNEPPPKSNSATFLADIERMRGSDPLGHSAKPAA